MNGRALVVFSLLLLGCREAGAPRPAPLPPPASDVAGARDPGPALKNQGGLRALLSALGDVQKIELLRWNPSAPAEPLAAADQERLLTLVREGALTDAHTLTTPPWPAVLLFHTRKHGSYAVMLVGHSNLRLHPGGPELKFEGDAAKWNHEPPPEMVLDDEEGWLWSYLEERLGATSEKEYRAPARAPDFLELPQRPPEHEQ